MFFTQGIYFYLGLNVRLSRLNQTSPYLSRLAVSSGVRLYTCMFLNTVLEILIKTSLIFDVLLYGIMIVD